MTHLAALLRVALRRPGDAAAALLLALTGRRQRARNRLHLVAATPPDAYDRWLREVERADAIVASIPAAIAGWATPPHISVLLHARPETDTAANAFPLADQLASLAAQTYPHWRAIIVAADPATAAAIPRAAHVEVLTETTSDPARALALAITAATGDWLLPLAADTLLPPTALYRTAEGANNTPAAAILYGDHDGLAQDRAGPYQRRDPWLKPAWNPDMFLAQDYLSPAAAIRANIARAALAAATTGDTANATLNLGDPAYALLLAAASLAGASTVIHIPHITAHRRDVLGSDTRAARLAIVQRHLAPQGATAHPGPFGTVAVQWPLPSPAPLVSILIPTRDNAALLDACVSSLLATTRYSAFEVLVIDNGSVQPAALATLTRLATAPRVRVLRDDSPFNYSALNNFGAAHAHGDYLCLLNDDTEIIAPDWLEAMIRQAARPDVGAVGALLTYGDGAIQHAGVTIGLNGTAGHPHRFTPSSAPGWFLRPHVAHQVSAVTAACLVVARAKYLAVGGLDAEGLRITYSDVELCLKLQAAGWYTVYTPAAHLLHHESRSRNRLAARRNDARYRAERALFQTRWRSETYEDPLHHPALDRDSETCQLRLP